MSPSETVEGMGVPEGTAVVEVKGLTTGSLETGGTDTIAVADADSVGVTVDCTLVICEVGLGLMTASLEDEGPNGVSGGLVDVDTEGIPTIMTEGLGACVTPCRALGEGPAVTSC